MQTQLNITGLLLIALALMHVFFPKYFNWKEQLSTLSIINRQMMYVHSFFIAFVVMLMGLLCLTSASDLLSTALGKRISLWLGIFWTIRLLIQFFGYSSQNWKGKSFETTVHFLLSLLWIYFSTVFYLAFGY